MIQENFDIRCVTPIHMVFVPGEIYDKNGKPINGRYCGPHIFEEYEKNPNRFRSRIPGEEPKLVTIDCGKCWACRRRKAAAQALRLMLEAKYYEEKYMSSDYVNFITFTYDDDNLPSTSYGEVTTQCEFEKERFIRALKRKLSYNGYSKEQIADIKYYWVSEYGSKSWRPHYHCMLYGVNLMQPLPYPSYKFDMYNLEYNGNGNPQYQSKMLDTIWKKGRVTFAPFCAKLASYIANYVVKVEDSFNFLNKHAYSYLCSEYGKDEAAKKILEIEEPCSYKSNSLGKRYIEKYHDKILSDHKLYLYGRMYDLIGYVADVLGEDLPQEERDQISARKEREREIKDNNLRFVRGISDIDAYFKANMAEGERTYKQRMRQRKEE